VKIDSSVDAAMREALTAAGAWERQRFDAAVDSMVDQGGEFADRSVSLALAVSSIAFYILNAQEWPTPERVEELARAYEEEQKWSGIESDTVRSYLNGLMAEDGAPLNEIAPAVFSRAVFALTGWLLTGFELPKGVAWNDFLDEIEDEIETRTS
jgi:hypothetical protein